MYLKAALSFKTERAAFLLEKWSLVKHSIQWSQFFAAGGRFHYKGELKPANEKAGPLF